MVAERWLTTEQLEHVLVLAQLHPDLPRLRIVKVLVSLLAKGAGGALLVEVLRQPRRPPAPA